MRVLNLRHPGHRPGPGHDLPLGGTCPRLPSGHLRNHQHSDHRLYHPVSGPSDQGQHHRPSHRRSGHGGGLRRIRAGIFLQVVPDSHSSADGAHLIRRIYDLCARSHGADPVIHAGFRGNENHRPDDL